MKEIAPTKAFSEFNKFLSDIHEPCDAIWLKFWNWHLNHPNVAERLRNLACKAQSRNYARYGIGAIWEVMRWHLQIVDGYKDEFKCSNDNRSRYARYLMWRYPELTGFFETRPLRATRFSREEAA